MNDGTYNGYSNYETWTVVLVITNTESLYNFFKNIVGDIKHAHQDETEQLHAMAESIKWVVEEMKPTTNNDMWNQLLTHTLECRIDYWEAAQALLDAY